MSCKILPPTSSKQEKKDTKKQPDNMEKRENLEDCGRWYDGTKTELAGKFQVVDWQITRTPKIPVGYISKNAHGGNIRKH